MNVVLALAACGALSPAAAAAAGRADLTVARLTVTPSSVAAGDKLPLAVVTRDAGKGKASKSVTAVYLSRDAKRSSDDVRLGQVAVKTLRPRRSASAKRQLQVPATMPAGRYRVLACADDRRRVKESKERNNCRAAVRSLEVRGGGGAPLPTGTTPVASGPPDADGDGIADASDCAPSDAGTHAGAADAPDLAFVDSNCDGIDGDAADAVFVSPAGDDAAAGTQSAPKRSITAALAAAAAAGKHEVLAAVGSYAERVALVEGVGIYGGYGPGWARPGPGATEISNGTAQFGRIEAVVANFLTRPTKLQRISVSAGASSTPGDNVYGVRAFNSPGLILEGDEVTAGSTANAAAGTTPGGHGANGGPGQQGNPGVERSASFGCSSNPLPAGGAGGTSSVGRQGGSGGQPGTGANAGSAGNPALPGGGLGGLGVGYHVNPGPDNVGQSGAPGADGASGAAGSTTFGESAGSVSGATGTAGGVGAGGGGGGGGGGGDLDCDSTGSSGGGGGGGAGGGQPGTGGASAGSSFAVYLWASNATITSSSLTAGNAGSGGAGGGGQPGGTGGQPGPGGPYGGSSEQDDGTNGAAGGHGGDGGDGGAGGGGAGGHSIGVLEGGGSSPTLSADAIAAGSAGAGGTSSGNAGPAGVAAATFAAP